MSTSPESLSITTASAAATQSPKIAAVPPLLGFATVSAGGLLGLEFQPISVEVASRRGPSSFQMVGLAETAVREARIRIGSALAQFGLNLDEYSLTVNLAPANVRKSGSGLDLAIAIAILGAIGHVSPELAKDSLFVAEVSLDGALRPIPGALPLLQGARDRGMGRAFVARENAPEAAQLEGLNIYAADGILNVLAHLKGQAPLCQVRPSPYQPTHGPQPDLLEVRGQEGAKRALVLAAAGYHHLLLVGPPGSGKSLLARRLPGLLPHLDMQEALETTALHSIAGVLGESRGVVDAPPFRAPHHTVSEVGLVGGGSTPRPGEISLAHNGVLFLDEMPEFRRAALEALRQPLEDHQVNIVRARFRTSFPARPLVVGAMNPCPCGNWGNPRGQCRCSTAARSRYLGRISGPLLDRIDVHVLVPPADLKSWKARTGESQRRGSLFYREAIKQARQVQEARHRCGDTMHPQNSLLSLKDLECVAQTNSEGDQLLEAAIEANQLSARAYVRVLRVARTLADLDGSTGVLAPHIGEALRYRLSDLTEL